MLTLLAKTANRALPWRSPPRYEETSKMSSASDTETMMDAPCL